MLLALVSANMDTKFELVADLASAAYFQDCFLNIENVKEHEFIAYVYANGFNRLTWLQFFDLLIEFKSIQDILDS